MSAHEIRAALAVTTRAVQHDLDLYRQDAERRMGLEAGAEEAANDPTYGALLDAFSAWIAASEGLKAALHRTP